MSRIKWLNLTLSLMMILVVLAGCGEAEPEIIKETVVVEKVVKETVTETIIVEGTPEVIEKEVEKIVQVEVTAVPEHTDPVTLVYWSDPRFTQVKGKEELTQEPGDYERLLAEAFMAMHPNVTIEVEALKWEDLTTKVTAAIAAGSPPNVLKDYLGRTSGYAWQGLLEPMEDAIPQEELDDYYPDLVTQYTIDGHMHGLPLFYWITHMTGNKALWEDVGALDLLPLDDGEWTFEEFEAAINAVKTGDDVWPYGLQVASEQGDYHYLGPIWGMGADLYAEGDYSQVVLDSPEGVAALEKIVQWVNEELIEPGATTITGEELNNIWMKGQMGVWGGGLATKNAVYVAEQEGRIDPDVKIDLFFAMYPHAADVKTGGMAAGPTGAVVFKQDDPEVRYWSIEFARFLANPDNQREYCINSSQFPSRKSVGTPLAGDVDYERLLGWIDEWGLENLGLASPNYYEVRVELYPRLQQAMLGEKTAAEALADYAEAANAILSGD